MHTFTDTQGRAWSVAITVDTIRRVRVLTGTDLMGVLGGDLIERLSGDPVLLADVLYAVVKPEAEARGVDDVDFGRALAGDAVAAATTALLEGLVGFFPSPRARLLRQALAKLEDWQTAALTAAEERLAVIEMPRGLVAPGPLSGDSPASAASTPPG
jgi:hypothetical protein